MNVENQKNIRLYFNLLPGSRFILLQEPLSNFHRKPRATPRTLCPLLSLCSGPSTSVDLQLVSIHTNLALVSVQETTRGFYL